MPRGPALATLLCAAWLPALAFFMVAAVIAVASYAAYLRYEASVIAEREAHLAGIAALKSSRLGDWLFERMSDARTLASDRHFAHHVQTWIARGAPGGEEAVHLQSRLAGLRDHYGYESVRLLDGDGRAHLAAGEDAGVVLERELALVRDAIDQRSVRRSELYQREDDKSAALYLDLAIPLFAREHAGRKGAAILMTIAASRSFELPAAGPLSPLESEEIALVRREGDRAVVARLRTEENGTPALALPLFDDRWVAVQTARGRHRMLEGLDFRGAPVIAAAAAVPNTGWFTIAEAHRQDVLESARDRIADFGALALFGIVLSAVPLGLWWRQRETGFRLAAAQAQLERQAAIVRDIGARKAAEQALRESEARYRTLLDVSPDAVAYMDAEGRLLTCNAQLAAMFGFAGPHKMAGRCMFDYLAPGDRERAAKWLHDPALPAVRRNLEYRFRRSDGSEFLAEFSISVVAGTGETPGALVGVIHDITERRRAEHALRASEARLEELAHHDGLTGLPNRTLFRDRLHEAAARAKRQSSTVGLLFVDLDRFKHVNDSLGQSAGDALLRDAGERLKALVRESGTVARLGGDEFAILLDSLDDAEDALPIAHNLLHAMSQPFEIAGATICVSASVGIACCPQDAGDTETLLLHADTALYRAKAEGRNTYRFFSPDMQERALDNLLMATHLRLALSRDEFILHYQPRVELLTGRTLGVEALIRWVHPQLGMVCPTRFIPIAEETGLIDEIGEWALRTACRQIRRWRDAGWPWLTVAVNLSARQFRQRDLADRIAAAIDAAGIPPAALEIEITESMVAHDEKDVAAMLGRLKSLGIVISIDDFGTGYSSLSRLKELPIDILKIDQSFVRGLPSKEHDAAIVCAILAMGRALGLHLVAEGVEQEEQRAYLRAQGCHHAQGYLFSRPLSAADFETFLGRGPA